MNNIQKAISIAVPILVLSIAIYFFSNLLNYLIIAWIVSLLGSPLKSFLTKIKIGKWKLSNTFATIIVLVGFMAIFFSIIGIFVPQIISQTDHLSSISQEEWISKLSDPLYAAGQWLEQMNFIKNASDLQSTIIQGFSDWFTPSMITNFFSSLLGFAGEFIIAFFSISFVSFFFIKEDDLFRKGLQSMVSNDKEDKVGHIIKTTAYLISRYFGGILAQVTSITTIVFIGLSLFGIKNALLIAFFAATINMIPYIGPLLGACFAIFMVITSNIEMPFDPFILNKIWKVVIVFGTMQLIDNFLLQPLIFSKSVRAHPLEIFFVILIGAQVAGIWGMVIAIPVYTVLRVVASVMLSEYQIVQKLTKSINSVDEDIANKKSRS